VIYALKLRIQVNPIYIIAVTTCMSGGLKAENADKLSFNFRKFKIQNSCKLSIDLPPIKSIQLIDCIVRII
jgi:hypothetical protein